MKKKLLAGLATVLFLLTLTGIALAGDDAKNKADGNNSKTTGLYDNVTILQEQINNLTERLNRIETLHAVEDRFTDMGDGTIIDHHSGLIWLKNANCSELAGVDENGKADWYTATNAATELKSGTCGLTDGSYPGMWRLPTPEEWEALLSTDYEKPALVNTRGDAQWSEGDPFTGVPSTDLLLFYWTSLMRTSTDAVAADVWDGGVWGGAIASWYYYVWPVRGDI